MQQSLILLWQQQSGENRGRKEGVAREKQGNLGYCPILDLLTKDSWFHIYLIKVGHQVLQRFPESKKFGKYLKKSVLSGLGWNWMVCQTSSVEAPEPFLSHPYLFSGVAPSNKTFSSSFLPSLSFDCWSLWNIWDSKLSKVKISPWQSLWSSHTIRHWTGGLSAPWKERSRNEIWSLTF